MIHRFLMASVVVCAALAMPLAAPAHSKANNKGGNIVGFCNTEILPVTPQANLGECVSYNQTFANSHEGGFPAHECDAFLELYPDDFYLVYDSYADCIHDYPRGH